jgi:hypothetical protein
MKSWELLVDIASCFLIIMPTSLLSHLPYLKPYLTWHLNCDEFVLLNFNLFVGAYEPKDDLQMPCRWQTNTLFQSKQPRCWDGESEGTWLKGEDVPSRVLVAEQWSARYLHYSL